VLETVKTQGHLSAQDIYEKIRRTHPEISVATVYRNLNILLEAGLVQVVGHTSQKEIYDARTDCHAHFICRGCGRIFDIEDLDHSPVLARLAAAGHHVTESKSTFYGLCAHCIEHQA
jgi:Fe2+ or Zn2+ uptake regulation protein